MTKPRETFEKQALITGTSSGIGLALARHLLVHHSNLNLVGLSRTPGPLIDEPTLKNRFQHWPTDLADLQAVAARGKRFRQEFDRFDLLVLAAGVGGFGPTDALKATELNRLVTLNLTSPMLLVGELLPLLKQEPPGLVVLVGSTSARERAPLGAAYAATKAGLKRFSEYLFAETRKSGVRVMHLCPGMTDTDFYRSERFSPKSGLNYSLDPECLAELLDFFFSGPGKTMNPTHCVVEPQKVGIEKVGSPRREPAAESRP